MGYFEIFLVASSIISISAGIRLFYENYKLAEHIVDAIENQIELKEELILAREEIYALKKKIK